MVLQELGRVKPLVVCCTNYCLRYLSLCLDTVHVHKDTFIILELLRSSFAECVLCVDLLRVITALVLRGTFTPRLEGHAFFSVHPLTLPLTVWWRKSLWSSKKNAKTETLLKVSKLAHALTAEKYNAIYCHIKAPDTTLLCTGNCGDINLVRLGSERTISKSLKLFSLDQQTKARAREKQIHALT